MQWVGVLQGDVLVTGGERPVVIGLGELLWDEFAEGRRPGGAPANVAFHANQLGCRGLVASRVGADTDGEALVRFLEERGLDTRCVQRDAKHPTGRVTVETTAAGEPAYVIHEGVAWDHLEFDASLESACREAAAVCFGTLAQRSGDSRETIHRCLQAAGASCLVVYDVNLRQRWYERAWVESSLHACGLVKLNGGEVGTLAGLLEMEAAHGAFAGELRQRYGVELVVVTLGERGCEIFGEGEIVVEPGVSVEVADAVGAGDAFTAALIACRLRGLSLSETAHRANRVGAMVASRVGAMPDLRDELAGLL